MKRRIPIGLLAIAVLACSRGSVPTVEARVEIACIPQNSQNLASRLSPYDSVRITIGERTAQLCYGRPSARGRTMIGGTAVPLGTLWRTGANEPTIIHLPFAASIACVDLSPGSYSIYTIPTDTDWTVIVNRSITQWGHEDRYTEAVRAQEVGRGTVTSERLPEHVEQFTIRVEPSDDDAVDLVLEWETTRVRIPLVPS